MHPFVEGRSAVGEKVMVVNDSEEHETLGVEAERVEVEALMKMVVRNISFQRITVVLVIFLT